MNILSLDSPYSPFFSLIVNNMTQVTSFYGLFSRLGYKHYFSGDDYYCIGSILRNYKTVTDADRELVIKSNNHYSAYVRKFKNRGMNCDEVDYFARFANFFRSYLKGKSIDFVFMHNDLRWHHAIARLICLEEGVPFCVSELGLFRPYTTTLDYNGVNANSSIKFLETDFSQYANTPNRNLNISSPFHGHDSWLSKLNFFYFLLLNKLGELIRTNSSISHNTFRIRPYIKRFWQQNVKCRFKLTLSQDEELPTKPYVFFPMQLENDTQFLIHSDFSSNQSLLEEVEKGFYSSKLAQSHQLVIKLHPNDLGHYKARNATIFTKSDTTLLVRKSSAVVSVNSTVCMEALETDKPLYVLGRAFFAREDICQPCDISELSTALSNPKPVDLESRRGFIYYLKYHYSVCGAGYSYSSNELKRIAKEIEKLVRQ